MAGRTFDQRMVLGKKRYDIDLTFFPDTANPPTVNANQARGVASVVRNSAGVFTITLEDAYLRLVSKNASVQLSSAADLKAQFGDISNLGTTTPVTVVVRLLAVATPTDMAADANNSVSVQLCFSDSDAF